MRTRILVGFTAGPLAILFVWLGGIWSALFLLAVALAAGYEFYAMMDHGGYHPNRWLGLVWLAALVWSGFQPDLLPLPLLLTTGLILTLCDALRQPDHPASIWFSTSIGALYLGVLTSQALSLRLLPNGFWWLATGLLIVWANDSAAYFAGVSIGKRKLWPRLSPKKTWEGTISGWIASAVAGALLVHFTPLPHSWIFGLVIGFFCGILGLLCDLSISMLKRQTGIKDTGNLLPGHGGMLDRIDSVLFVLPFIYLIVNYWPGA
jgi:phosphatidate cytidylyltransferase